MKPGSADLAREARVAGLRRYVTPSLEAVESRRAQLWVVAFVVMGGLSGGMLLLTSTTHPGGPFSTNALRLALVGVSVAFGCYVMEKEIHLRRLTRLLVDERVLAAALSNRLDEMRQLSLKESAVNADLHLDQTAAVVLDSAIELLGGVSGAMYLRDSDGVLRLHTTRGPESPAAGASTGGLVARVAGSGDALLGDDDDAVAEATAGAVMAVPLTRDGGVDGVLLVRRGADGTFSEYDLRVLARFAEHSASAVAHAALYEGERRQVEELVERDRAKSSFVAMVSHELKAPLAAIIGATKTLQRPDLPPEHVAGFLEMIEKQGERLARLVEDVLELRRAEGIGAPEVRPVDLAAVTRSVCQLSRAGGRPVELRAPGVVVVNADPEALEQILLNLIENAFIHGWGTVEVEVAREADTVRVSVLDRGAGVAPEERARVFDPFARGSQVGGRGSGLGLYLVKTLAEAQGGTVTVSERPGGGADFTVRLPALGATAEAGHMTGADVEATVGVQR